MTPGPAAGAEARKALGETIIYGVCGRLVSEDYMVRVEGEPDLVVNGDVYSAVARAEALHADTGLPVRVVRIEEREVATVGVAYGRQS